MKAFAITNKGTEEFCKKELGLFEFTHLKADERIVFFESKDYDSICRLVYLGQSMSRVALYLGNFEFESGADVQSKTKDFFSELKKSIEKSDVKRWMHDGLTFKAECIRNGEHDFTSNDAEKKAGGFLLEAASSNATVDVKNPTLNVIFLVNQSKCSWGIDFAGFDLGQRDYKIFPNRQSLNGTIAYSLLQLADWNPKKEILLDPMCGSGTIPLEAAFFQTHLSHNHYRKEKLAFSRMNLEFDQTKFFNDIDKKAKFSDKINIFGSDMLLACINASEKNAKIAGLHKAVRISRIDADWLDTKFEENAVDVIVTHFPAGKEAKDFEKLFKELFYQIDFIMKKKNTRIVAVVNDIDLMNKFASEFSFILEGKYGIWQGKEKLNVGKWVR